MNDDRNIDPMVAELLSQQALQQLDAAETVRLQRMLAEDPALADEAAELCRVVDLLALTTRCEPPQHLRERVLAAARLAANSQPAARVVRTRAPHPWHMFASWSLAAAASFACAILLVQRAEERQEISKERKQWTEQTDHLNRQLDLKAKAASMLLEPNVVVDFPLDGRNPAATALGYVLLDLDARRASIAVLDLPPAPAGHSYHLWAVLESQGKVPCGRFTPEADGRILTQFPIPVDSYTSPIQRLILTVEPDHDQTAPRGTTVMTS
jgi:Anti-sigma-K factor rskA